MTKQQSSFLDNFNKIPNDVKSLLMNLSNFNLKNFFSQNRAVFAFLAFLVFAVYLNSLPNEFVSDDIPAILNNENLDNLAIIFSSPLRALRSFQPSLYFLINHFLGKSPAAFRFANICFHLLTTVTIYLIIYFLHNRTLAIFTASVMAVHPVITESVAWISGGGHTMYSFFLILSLFLYTLSTKKENYLYLSMIAFLLALIISEKAIIFPLILLAYSISYKMKPKNWKKLAILALPTLIIGLIFLAQAPGRLKWLQTSHYQEGGFIDPFLQIPIAITSYLELIFWPKNLTLYHSEMSFSQGEYLLRLIVFIVFLGIIAYSFKRNRPVFFWLSFFIISLLPTLTPFGISWIVAERYVYLGSLGIFVVIALLIQKIGQVFKNKNISYALFAIILITLSIRTIIRNADWKNQDTLWLATAKTSPSSPQNHNNLGDLYGRQGDFEKSIYHFKKAIELNPRYADAYHNLANTYAQIDNIDLAIENYQKAVEFGPHLWQSHQNLAGIYFEQEKYDLAEKEMKKAIKINPQNANLYTNLGIVYLKLNDNEKAKQAFQQALQLNPQDIRARQLLTP